MLSGKNIVIYMNYIMNLWISFKNYTQEKDSYQGSNYIFKMKRENDYTFTSFRSFFILKSDGNLSYYVRATALGNSERLLFAKIHWRVFNFIQIILARISSHFLVFLIT